MATVAEVLQSAYRISKVQARAQSIVAGQRDVGLERLSGFYRKMVADGLFGPLTDHRLTTAAAYEAKEGQRVINTAAAAVTYPSTVLDVFDGCTRTPRDLAVISVVVPGSNPIIKIYDAWMAEWIAVDTLVYTDYCPLTFRFEEHIKNLLAVHLADENSIAISPLLARNAGTARLTIASNHGAPRKPVQQDYF